MYVPSHAALTIGLSQTVYTVIEGTPLIEVCAEVMSGIVERSTIVSLATVDSTAEGIRPRCMGIWDMCMS